jgi:hypothetical protein
MVIMCTPEIDPEVNSIRIPAKLSRRAYAKSRTLEESGLAGDFKLALYFCLQISHLCEAAVLPWTS